MGLPIVWYGLYRQSGNPWSGTWYYRQFREKQTRPIDTKLQLRYGVYLERLTEFQAWGGITPSAPSLYPYWSYNSQVSQNSWFFNNYGPGAFPSSATIDRAYARAYAKFLDACYTRAATMTNIAERGSTIAMLTNRLSQLYKGARQLKTGDFAGFVQTFGITPKAKHKDLKWTRPKQFAGLWLEYWFGWAPTISDIYTAVENYGKPVKDVRVKQGSQSVWNFTKSESDGGWYQCTNTESGTVRINISGRIAVDNPSLFELNRLGLVNPAVTALEVIPFSWLAGWFVNLQQVLSQYTDFVGLKLMDATVSIKTEGAHSYFSPNHGKWGAGVSQKRRIQTYVRGTVTTLPRVKIVAQLPNGLSVTRGATLASLLVQLFAPVRK